MLVALLKKNFFLACHLGRWVLLLQVCRDAMPLLFISQGTSALGGSHGCFSLSWTLQLGWDLIFYWIFLIHTSRFRALRFPRVTLVFIQLNSVNCPPVLHPTFLRCNASRLPKTILISFTPAFQGSILKSMQNEAYAVWSIVSSQLSNHHKFYV